MRCSRPSTATMRAHPQRQDADHGRAVRRDQGAARRLLPGRGEGSRRGDRDRRARSRRARTGTIEVRPDHGCSRAERPWHAGARATPGAVQPSRDAIERRLQQERGAILATLIRVLRRLRLGRGGARRRRSRRRSCSGRARATPDEPARLARSARRATRRSIGCGGARCSRTSAPRSSRRRARARRRGAATIDEVAVARRSAAPDLHLLPPGAGRRGAGRADAAHAVRPRRPRRSRARSWCRRRRWRSGWCARRRRSATRGIPYRVPDAERAAGARSTR